MVWWFLDCSRRQSCLRGKAQRQTVLLFVAAFMSFLWENKREKFTNGEIWFKRFFLYARASLLIFLDFPRLVLKLVERWCLLDFECGWRASCQTLHARLYTPSESAQTSEGLYFLFHSACCDAGTGGQPCVEMQALYTPRQLLEWVWICQPVIYVPPPPLYPSPTHHPELMTASPHLHPIRTRMLRQLKMFTSIAKTLHVPQSSLFSLWWDC